MSLLETEGWLIVGVYQQTHSKLKIYQGLLVVEGSWGGLEMSEKRKTQSIGMCCFYTTVKRKSIICMLLLRKTGRA